MTFPQVNLGGVLLYSSLFYSSDPGTLLSIASLIRGNLVTSPAGPSGPSQARRRCREAGPLERASLIEKKAEVTVCYQIDHLV